MAGQPLERDARDRIGSFNLKLVLERLSNPNNALSKGHVLFRDVQHYLGENGGRLPSTLVSDLRLNQFQWTYYDRNAITMVHFGTSKPNQPHSPDIDGSVMEEILDVSPIEATIEIAQRVNLEGKRIPIAVRTASNYAGRAIGVAYDLLDGELTSVTFSVEEGVEVDAYALFDIHEHALTAVVDVPTAWQKNDPYETSALITASMVPPNHEVGFKFDYEKIWSHPPFEGEDFNKYFQEQLDIFRSLGIEVVFQPDVLNFTPQQEDTSIDPKPFSIPRRLTRI